MTNMMTKKRMSNLAAAMISENAESFRENVKNCRMRRKIVRVFIEENMR